MTEIVVPFAETDYELLLGELLVTRDVTVRGRGDEMPTISPGVDNPSRVFLIAETAKAELSGLRIANGDNQGGAGGGIFIDTAASLVLTDSEVTDNVAGSGGGIWSDGTLQVDRSLIAFNDALGNGDGGDGFGGGIGLSLDSDEVTLTNTTLSGNQVFGFGGGIYTERSMTLRNVSIVGNGAPPPDPNLHGGGLYQAFAAGGAQRTTASNMLVAQNFNGGCGGTAGEFFIESTSGMLDEDDDVPDPTCNTVGDGNIVTEDALIGPLEDNGGPTLTHGLLAGSPAIDAGGAPCPPDDQRGFGRPADPDLCDIGAYEADVVRIDGTPLDVWSDGRGRLQFRLDGEELGVFYDPLDNAADAGLEIKQGDVHYPLGEGRTTVSPPVVDTAGDTHTMTSSYKVGPDLLVIETITYVDGGQGVDIRYAIQNTSSTTVSFRAGELADLFVAGSDLGTGVFTDGEPRFVGGRSTGGVVTGIVERTPWTRFQEGHYGSVFDNFASDGLTDTIDPELVDNGVGVEWERTVDPAQTETIELSWRAGVAPTLRVVTNVINDAGGSAAPSSFQVGVFAGGVQVASAPGAAEPGTAYDLAAGGYVVVPSGPASYLASFSGGCAPGGTVELFEGQQVTCTITFDETAIPAGTSCVQYDDFSPPTGLNLLGDAAAVDGILRVTPAGFDQQGQAWFESRRPLTAGFTSDFRLRISDLGGGADGLTFAVQNAGVDATGVAGGGLGYAGLPNSLVVEFDTWHNPEIGDPGQDHVAVHSLGPEPNDHGPAAELGQAVLPESLDDQEVHHVRIAYEPGTLRVFFDDMATPLLVVPVDLSTLLNHDNGTAFVGFTAATGAAYENHDVLDWGFCSTPLPATLRIVTTVVNDNGGVRSPGDFTVRIRGSGTDLAHAGSADHRLPAGSYTVSADGLPGYSVAVGGDCAGNGSVTLPSGQARTCTVTADDAAPQPQPSQPPPEEAELPPPEAGESVNVEPKQGTVKVKLKGTNKFVELEAGQQIPLGTVVDTRNGRVSLTAASNTSGGTATADFYDGLFVVGQTGGTKPTTTLRLSEKLACPKGKAAVAASRKKKRRLWGDGSGRFRTEGSYSSATVRGTRWLTEDTCTSTLTRVVRGSVSVRDFAKKKTVMVKAGKTYVARRR